MYMYAFLFVDLLTSSTGWQYMSNCIEKERHRALLITNVL